MTIYSLVGNLSSGKFLLANNLYPLGADSSFLATKVSPLNENPSPSGDKNLLSST